MRAYIIGDGGSSVIELGHRYIQIIGEPNDEGDYIILENVRAQANYCDLAAHHCYLRLSDGVIIESEPEPVKPKRRWWQRA